MPEHGEFDLQAQKWFCSYWMSQAEWEDIHDYAPPSTDIVNGRKSNSSEVPLSEHSEHFYSNQHPLQPGLLQQQNYEEVEEEEEGEGA
jgi:hypothetical protein